MTPISVTAKFVEEVQLASDRVLQQWNAEGQYNRGELRVCRIRVKKMIHLTSVEATTVQCQKWMIAVALYLLLLCDYGDRDRENVTPTTELRRNYDSDFKDSSYLANFADFSCDKVPL